jgi:hypothetical protein
MMSFTNKPFMLSVVMLSVIYAVSFILSFTNKPFMLSIVMLNFVILSVVMLRDVNAVIRGNFILLHKS